MMKHPIFPEFLKYASLNCLGMLGLSCYILADTFFVSMALGADGLAALNLAIPIYSFLNGAGLMLGMGGATKYSILKSQGESSAANQVFTHTVLLALCFAVFFFTAGAGFSGSIASLFGVTGSVLAMSETYLRVILLFSPLFLLNNVMLCFVRNDGAPQLSMAAMLAGSFSNVILDYVFMFPMGMGIFGAVFATGLAPAISLLTLSPHFFRKRNCFRPVKPRLSARLCAGIFSGGVPSLVTELSSGIVILVFNALILKLQGNTGVAAYGVIANLSLVAVAVFTGIAQGVQPILSRNYGMGNHGNVRATLRYAFLSAVLVAGLLYVGVFFGAEQIAAVFNSGRDPLLQSIAVTGLRIYFTGCLFAGFNIILSLYFTSTENAKPAHLISLLRGFFIILPLSFLFSSVWGMTGVWCVFPVTELLTATVGGLLFLKNKNLKSL